MMKGVDVQEMDALKTCTAGIKLNISGEKEAVQALIEFGLKKEKAQKLTSSYPLDRVIRCIEYVSSKRPHNPAGYFLRALKEHWILPE